MAKQRRYPKNYQAEQRRERTAYWRLRGLSHREIAEKLNEEGFTSYLGNPINIGCVQTDLNAIQKVWRENYCRDISEHQEKQLAFLEELQRETMSLAETKKKNGEPYEQDLSLAYQIHDRVAKLLGSNQPERQTIQSEVIQQNLSQINIQLVKREEPNAS